MTGYYVTIVRGRRVGYLIGPCPTETEARDQIPLARAVAEDIDPFACFDLFGTALVTARRLPPGSLNERIGYKPTEATP